MAAYPLNNILHFEIVRFVQAALHTRHLKLAVRRRPSRSLARLLGERYRAPTHTHGARVRVWKH